MPREDADPMTINKRQLIVIGSQGLSILSGRKLYPQYGHRGSGSAKGNDPRGNARRNRCSFCRALSAGGVTMADKEAVLSKKWKEFDKKLPKEITLPGAGFSGEDIILKKSWIDGILTYAADLDTPMDRFQYVTSNLGEE
jgi:hypothetical protein